MEEKGSGIPVEDLAKESGGRHGAMEHAHAGRMTTGASPLGEVTRMLEDTATSAGPLV
jgi:hypothetical protein